jgi:hypothetical protein
MKSLRKHARAHLFGGDTGGLTPAIANDGSGLMTMQDALMTMRDADVLIAGAGPTGLMLAGVGAWELPAFGAVSAPTAVLIRPDGHVAWVGDRADPGLPDALTTWFGPPAAA